MTKHFTSGKVLVLFDQALVSGGNFTLGVLLARYLGVGVFGEYCLLWMGVMFILSLHQSFMTKPLMSLFAGKKRSMQTAYIQSLSLLQIAISASVAGMAVVAYFIVKMMGAQAAWTLYLPLTGFLAAMYLLQDFLRKMFFVKQQYQQPLFMDIVLYVPLLLTLIVLHSLDKLDLVSVLLTMSVMYTISSGFGFFISRDSNQGTNTAECTPKPQGQSWSNLEQTKLNKKEHFKKTVNEHYHYSFWLLGTSLVQWFSGNFFLIAAASVLGTVAVGALRMAQNMVGLCHVLFLAMENIIPAEAAQHFFHNGKKAMFNYLKRVALWGSFPVLLLLGVLTLASPLLIGWLYGPEYQPYGYLVGAYSLHYLFVYIGYPLRFALRTLHHTSPIFFAYCLNAVLSLLVAFPIVDGWGLGGVMAGLIGTQVLTLTVYIYFLNHKKLNYHKQYENHPRSTW